MNYRELLSIVIVGFAFTLLTQYVIEKFIFSGRRASTQRELARPLYTEIDFRDAPSRHKNIPQEINTVVKTDHAEYEFSTAGAVLRRMAIFRPGTSAPVLNTITPPETVDRELGCFLVAFPTETPYEYSLVDQQELPDRIILTYTAGYRSGEVVKKYTVYRDNYCIDLELSVNNIMENGLRARIVVPAPSIAALGAADKVQGVVNKIGSSSSIELVSLQEKDFFGRAWENPVLFGLEDRYVAHVLIADTGHMVQRGYFVGSSNQQVRSFIETKILDRDSSVTFSWFCGPKESSVLRAVDSRLEQLLGYGWFSPIAYPLLQFLNWSNQYTHSYGWGIIMVIILIILLLIPLSIRAERAQKTQREVQRKLHYISTRFPGDRQRLMEEREAIMKTHGAPELTMFAPLLAQIPFMMALSCVLGSAIELYKAPFLWIPDLSARDPYFILPIVFFVTMISTPGNSAAPVKQRLAGAVIALVFAGFMSYWSAGFALYMTVMTGARVLQGYIFRSMRVAE